MRHRTRRLINQAFFIFCIGAVVVLAVLTITGVVDVQPFPILFLIRW